MRVACSLCHLRRVRWACRSSMVPVSIVRYACALLFLLLSVRALVLALRSGKRFNLNELACLCFAIVLTFGACAGLLSLVVVMANTKHRITQSKIGENTTDRQLGIGQAVGLIREGSRFDTCFLCFASGSNRCGSLLQFALGVYVGTFGACACHGCSRIGNASSPHCAPCSRGA